ncbi:MAG: flagellar basal body L-ring protein FlgH [Limnochordia bacterium]|jgi:flagellar L-ring protein precursor FlgH
MNTEAGIRFGVCLALLGAALLGLLVTPPLAASSLWHEGAGSLYTTAPRTWQVGDLITVIIVEQAQATQTASTETQKKSGVGVGVELPWDPSGHLSADIEGGDRLRSTGKTVRGGTLRASVTAEVKALEPSGNLRIEGRQTIVVNGETQEIVLSGVVRPEDIGKDNAVLSTSVAEAEIAYQGAGSLGGKQRQGIITRFFHWLF